MMNFKNILAMFVLMLSVILIQGCSQEETKELEIFSDEHLNRHASYVIFNDSEFNIPKNTQQFLRTTIISNKKLNSFDLLDYNYTNKDSNLLELQVKDFHEVEIYNNYYIYNVLIEAKVSKPKNNTSINISSLKANIDNEEVTINVDHYIDIYLHGDNDFIPLPSTSYTYRESDENFNSYLTIGSNSNIIVQEIKFSGHYLETNQDYKDMQELISKDELPTRYRINTKFIDDLSYGQVIDYFIITYKVIGDTEYKIVPFGDTEVEFENSAKTYIDLNL